MPSAASALHHFEHFADEFGIERRGRLVEQHQPRLHRQRARDGDALLLAAGEARRIGVRLVGEADARQHRHRALVRLLAAEPAHAPQRLGDVAERGHVRPQIEVLEHHADLAAHLAQAARAHRPPRPVLAGLVADQLAFDPDLAVVVGSRKLTQRSSVLLPEPLGPIRQTTSERATSGRRRAAPGARRSSCPRRGFRSSGRSCRSSPGKR